MREICPACGGDMTVTKEAFVLREGVEIVGIEHNECPVCREITFTPEQLDMLFGYRTAQRQLASTCAK